MTFIDFARAHGVEIDPNRLYPSDRIKRCGTVERPRSGNGAYFYDGQRGSLLHARRGAHRLPPAKPLLARQASLLGQRARGRR